MTSIKSLQFLFGVIIIIALLLSYLTYRSLNKMINDAQWVNSTNVVLGELEKVISLVKDGEIAYRGYELTADSLYLEPYHNSKWMALSKIDMIDSLMRNERQQYQIDTLRILVDEQYNIIEAIIRSDEEKIDEDSLLYAGNENITKLRALVDNIKGDELDLLRERTWGKNNPDKITPILIFMSYVFAIGVVVYLFSQIFKSLRTKIVAERALEKNLMQLSKEVNEKVRAQESLQSVLDSSPNGILFMEAIRQDGKIVDFNLLFGNRGVEKHLNISLEQVLGKKLLDLLSGNIRAAALDLCVQATETGEEIERDFYYQDNKVEAWYHVTAVKLEDGCVITLTDTTVQKKTAKLIEESRQKFEAIFNKAFQFIGLLDKNGRFLDINQTALEFSGRTKEMIIGKYLWSTWGSLSREAEVRVQWAVRKAAKGEFIRYEVNVTGLNNQSLPLDFSLKPIKDEQGAISFIILEGRDLTEIKKAEAERSFISMLNLTIANSNSFEQALNRIFHHIAERFDLDYCEVWLPEGEELVLSEIFYAREKKLEQLHRNSRFSRLKKGEGLPGRVMETFEMQYIEDIDSIMEERFIRMDKAIDFGVTTAFGIPIIFNNEMVLVSTFFSKRQIEEVEEIINAIQQISSSLGALLLKKKTQDEIEKNNIILAAAESMAKIGSWEWNIASNKVKWSRGAFDLHYKSLEDFQPTYDSFLQNIYAEDIEMVESLLQQAVRDKTCFKMEFRVQLPNGEIKHHSAVATPKLDASGAIESLYGTIQDITQQKHYEHDLLVKNEELKKSNENLEQFAYVASHDLQEPLRKIRAFGDRLQTMYEPVLDEKGRDYISRMRGAAERMQSLIEDLLRYSRVARNREPFTKVNLNKVIQGVMADLELTIKERNAIVKVDNLPPVEGDAVQLRQLFQNLISNSIKFTPNDRVPQVTIQGKQIKGAIVKKVFNYKADHLKNFVQIDVSDNGIGFEVKYADRIFNIFERLHGRSEFKGTGIGLAISQKVVQNHQGAIWASGEKDKGAKFTIVLPLNINNYG